VSLTSAVDENGRIAWEIDPYAQAVHALRNVQATLRAAGASLAHAVRARIYLARFADVAAVARAHAERFCEIRPALSIIS